MTSYTVEQAKKLWCPPAIGEGWMQIRTEYIYPPIPIRSFDWCAYDDDLGADCSPVGYGATEQEAIDDLMEQIDGRS